MDALYPPLFAVGDLVTITETGKQGMVMNTRWINNEWQVLVDQPLSMHSAIRQTFRQSELSEWMLK
jgi:hypothetical protein